MRTHAKRWLFLIHRWLGIIACAFFAMWFVSGVVMMYVGYPKLTEAERLQHLPPLGTGSGLLAPRQVLAATGIAGPLKELRLAAASGGRAVYLAVPLEAGSATGMHRAPPPGSGVVTIDARSGARLQNVDAHLALASAASYAGPGVSLDHRGAVGEDAFTLPGAHDALGEHVHGFMESHKYFDTVGQFYIEFLRYANNDKGLGIVLTPPHITELFVDIAEVGKDSIVVDSCCGTGGFLISAMKKMVHSGSLKINPNSSFVHGSRLSDALPPISTLRRSKGLLLNQPLSRATLNRARRLTRMLSAVVAVLPCLTAQACSLSRSSMPMVRLTESRGRSPIRLTN